MAHPGQYLMEELRSSREDIENQDMRFIGAMLAAITSRRETAPIGVNRDPCTENPIYYHAASLERSVTGSQFD